MQNNNQNESMNNNGEPPKIPTNNGDTFYVTNTSASITLENNTIVNNDSDDNFFKVQKDSWRNTNSNGGNVVLKMTNQSVKGNIVIDSISTLDITLSDNSKYEGAINVKNEAKSIKLKLDKTSKITLTEDSYITSLDNEDTTNSNIDFNGYKLYVNVLKLINRLRKQKLNKEWFMIYFL